MRDKDIPREILNFLKQGDSYCEEDICYYFMPLVFKINEEGFYEILNNGDYIPLNAKYKFKKKVNKVLSFDMSDN